MSQYFFSKEAEKDLIDIYRYGFLAHGKHQAEQYLQSLKEKCQFLATNPKLSHERREFTPPIRINGHKQHLIIYLSNEDSITVVRILHKKQARHATSQHSGTPVTNIHSPTQRMGDALVALRPSQLRTKPCSVKTTSNGWTAIRNAILASLARY